MSDPDLKIIEKPDAEQPFPDLLYNTAVKVLNPRDKLTFGMIRASILKISDYAVHGSRADFYFFVIDSNSIRLYFQSKPKTEI